MDKREQKRISKFLSLVLRHQPETVGISLDEAGWIPVNDLLSALNSHPAGRGVTRDQLDTVVAENDKQRFEFNDDATMIRASQGHSLDVELGYEEVSPPDTLYHGTSVQFVDAIRQEGLKKRQRHHVHLSPAIETATVV